MQYKHIESAVFLRRPNRFIAEVLLRGKTETVHVKNTGRCRELLLPGTTVYLSAAENPDRKTKYDLVAVEKQRNGDTLCINMDSQIANDVAQEWLRTGALFGENAHIRREVSHGRSRFDFYIEQGERKIFLEVKGCTLEQDGVALFPDAPTQRGVKHITELTACLQDGYEACILFVLQMKGVHVFRPHDAMHPQFGDALRKARQAGVHILAMDCAVAPDSIRIDAPVAVRL